MTISETFDSTDLEFFSPVYHTLAIKSMMKPSVSAGDDAISEPSATVSGLKSIGLVAPSECGYDKHIAPVSLEEPV